MNGQINKKESIKFFRRLAPGETITLSERIKGDGLITAIKGMFYSGQALKLHIKPMVLKNQIMVTNLVSFPEDGEQYLAGDDEAINHEIAIEVSNDDMLKVWAENIDTDIITLSLTIEVDYYGGKNRVV